VLLQGPAVADLAYLATLGLRYRARTDGLPATVHHRRLLALLTAAAVDLAAMSGRDGHADGHQAPDLPTSEVGEVVMRSEAVARALGITARQVRRMAEELGGRRIGRVWEYDRTAVLAAVTRRQETRG
jgi:hypothetical protein